MKITFLGTGTSQGVPVIACKCKTCTSSDPRDNRLRSSVLVESEGTSLVIDTGPDFRQQMLRHRVEKLDAVLFTHEHRDHIAGLDDIRAFNFIQQQAMDVYAEERVFRALNYEFPYIFAEKKYPGIPQLTMNVIAGTHFSIKSLLIEPVRVMHYRLPVLGFRIGNFAYITDANYISEEEMKKLRGLDILVINALRREKHISHYNLPQALEVIQELKPEMGYLTHLSHQIGLHAELMEELPENVTVAFDGLELSI
ncbi:MAG: MBL fold metallo-hydrolase [Bacteroidales bacterium]|nr:MBL fold metallo-hydrolase [Bacteroidales bacterium]MCB9013971.1 MBL fold metallo-hydrolase [Bacteroidales bacterium]